MTKETGKKDYAVCDQCRTKKIRCGREKPSCANCVRMGQQCKWSGQGKKCNQTALLSHTILGLGSRLQHLESSVLDTQNSLKRLLEGSSLTSPPPSRPSTSRKASVLPSPASDILNRPPIFTRPLGRFLADHSTSTSEKYFGPTSLDSLALDIKDLIIEHISSDTQSLRDSTEIAQQKIERLVGQGEEDPIKDGSLPTVPPFAILDAMIEPYFATINPRFPIWSKDRFHRIATSLRQSESPEQELASIICCNNVTLMALSANSLASRRGKPMTNNPHARKRSSVDFDVIAGFLANAKRALENIDRIVSPQLINVQALLSLCFVAQEHMSTGLAETLFVLAARCARSIGIHQWQCLSGQLSDIDVQERRNVSYCLYILDKAICWTNGSRPNLSVADVDLDGTLMWSDKDTQIYLSAKVELVKIEETIYTEVYASQAQARTEDQALSFTSKMMRKLQEWLAYSGTDLDLVEKDEDNLSKVEYALGFFSAQLLLIWPYKDHPSAIFQDGQEIARRYMRLMLRLWRSPSDQGQHAIIPLFAASYPPLYLYEITKAIIAGHGQDSDVELCREFTEMLEVITESREEKSYNRRIYQISLILTDFLSARKAQFKQRRTESDIDHPSIIHLPQSNYSSSVPTAMSDMFSPSNSSYSHLTPPNLLETEDHYFSSSAFADTDESYDLLNPIEHGNGEEIISPIGNHAKGLADNLSFLAYDLDSLRQNFSEHEV